MRRVLSPVLLFAVVALALWLPDGGEAGERIEKRVPGTIRIEGDPDRVGDFTVVPAFPNLRFQRPLWIGHAPDGTNRLYVIEQDGVIKYFENRRDVQQVGVCFDMRGKAYRRHNEEGLLGMAFHPDYARNRYVFLHYSANPPRRGVVSRFKMNAAGTRLDPRSERVVLEQRQRWGNHNGGDLQFGPDGYLYITFGDGGAANDPLGSGQDLSTWLGSLLRIDVDRLPYRVPKDNPFVGRRGARPEIWAYGLRNIWRFSFDRLTGDLWGGDVGQNAWEEIDVIVKGGNYGWNRREGAHPFRPGPVADPMIDPVIEFDTRLARSITGGYVYRGQRMPRLVGTYLYADYATGNVWGLRYDGEKVLENRLLARGQSVSTFGEDRAGEVYYASFDGRIYTFAPRGRDTPGAIFPRRLSETGLFTDTAKLTPHPSLVPYTLNVPFWSDGAAKERFVMLPGTERVAVDAEGRYRFPRGTIFVKTFFVPDRSRTTGGRAAGGTRLETRLLVHRDEGWVGYTYVWDANGQDAELIDGRVERPMPADLQRRGVAATWTFPGRSDCMSCHTAAAGRVLGFRAEQLDREEEYAGHRENQLAVFERVGLFEGKATPRNGAFPDWEDIRADRDRLARAYLDANCANCHQPGAPGNASIDLRWQTPLEKTNTVRVKPGEGDLGVRGATLIEPGSAPRSLLYVRMQRTDEKGMPTLGHNAVDKKALRVLSEWIRGMR